MEMNLNTPALLFPAITLLLLAYTNRFLAIANLIRKLHDEYISGKEKHMLLEQLQNLKKRINYIRMMQALGVVSFLCCVVCMFSIYKKWMVAAEYIFAASLLSLLASLIISLIEIFLSTKALELQLSDIEELEKSNFLSRFISGSTEKKDS
jgi:nucleoside permease NupC